MDASLRAQARRTRFLVWLALAVGCGLLLFTALDGLSVAWAALQGYEDAGVVARHEAVVALQIAALGSATWSLASFLRGRRVRWRLIAVAYGLGVAMTPAVYLLWLSSDLSNPVPGATAATAPALSICPGSDLAVRSRIFCVGLGSAAFRSRSRTV
jgi:hypothetical protein